MTRLEDLKPNATVRGLVPDTLVTIVTRQWSGSDTLELTYKTPAGQVVTESIDRQDEARLEVMEPGRAASREGDGNRPRTNKASQKYRLSFIAVSLSIRESITVAATYLKCEDWTETRRIVKDENLLQSRTKSRTTRVLTEIILRLKLLSTEQLKLLVAGSLAEQKYLLWFAICKTYSFIQEFALEVLREKYLSRAVKVTELDYEAFFNRRADWNAALGNITPLTRQKMRQIVFRMLREADLLTDDNTILSALPSSRLSVALKPDAPLSFDIFPMDFM